MSPDLEYWPTDGHEHRKLDLDAIFRNGRIDSFLSSDNRICLLIAGKGMGKTLLLRVKRNLLRANETDASAPLLVIPEGRDLLDTPKIVGSFPKGGFQSIQLWQDLWSIATILSAVTHLSAKKEIQDENGLLDKIIELDIDHDFFLDALAKGDKLLPSHCLQRLLTHTESQLQRVIKNNSAIERLSHDYIRSGVVILVDAFDQALLEAFGSNLEAWKAGQLGLAKAAHSLFIHNSHIKVIASIRQEAWAGFNDDDAEVIGGKSIILEYDTRELRAIFEKAIHQYARRDSIKQFFCVDTIHNKHLNQDEDCFAYVLRHSVSTPRALMHFGRELDNAKLDERTADDRQETIRDIVDQIASEKVTKEYLGDQKIQFLRTLHDRDLLKQFLRLIPSNVLTGSSLKSINSKFYKAAHIPRDDSHPFCELRNIGLLGKVQQNLSDGGFTQHFKKSHEFDWQLKEILDESEIYLVHPGLFSSIACMRHININRVNIIGSDRTWNSPEEHNGIPQVFVSHKAEDKPKVEKILRRLKRDMDLRFPCKVWEDSKDLLKGEVIAVAIDRALKRSDVFLLFASTASLQSGWVVEEWAAKFHEGASTKNIRIVVVMLDDAKEEDLPVMLKTRLTVRISESNWKRDIQNLAESVCGHADESLKRRFSVKP